MSEEQIRETRTPSELGCVGCGVTSEGSARSLDGSASWLNPERSRTHVRTGSGAFACLKLRWPRKALDASATVTPGVLTVPPTVVV